MMPEGEGEDDSNGDPLIAVVGGTADGEGGPLGLDGDGGGEDVPAEDELVNDFEDVLEHVGGWGRYQVSQKGSI